MAEHSRKKTGFFTRLTRKQAIILIASVAALALLIVGGVASNHLYRSTTGSVQKITAFSASEESASQVAAADAKAALAEGRNGVTEGTSYTKVVINGHAKLVFGTNFTDVQSVLQQGNITLQPGDSITPSLTTKVTESTVINIVSAGDTVQTVDTPIPFNTIQKDDPNLPVGVRQVQTQGQPGVMETTNLVQMSGTRQVSSNTIASWVKKVPVNEVILVGTGTTSSSSNSRASNANSNSGSSSNSHSTSSNSNSAPRSSSSSSITNIGTTVPVGNPQQIAQTMAAARGWTGAQFTCLVELWQRESGWRVTAENPSGAYGIPQALPGSKMGPGWQSSATVQISWGLGYIASRYGTPCGAWSHELSAGWY